MLILLLSFIAAVCCVGLVLTKKAHTTSLEILALLAVFIGAVRNFEPVFIPGAAKGSGTLLVFGGVVCYLALALTRGALSDWLANLYYDATAQHPQHPQRRITDRRK